MDILFEYPRLLPTILVAMIMAIQVHPAFKNSLGKLFIPLQLSFGVCVAAVLVTLLPNNLEILVNSVSKTIFSVKIDWLFGFIPKPSFTDVVWATYAIVSAAVTSFLSYFIFIFVNIPLVYQEVQSENKKVKRGPWG